MSRLAPIAVTLLLIGPSEAYADSRGRVSPSNWWSHWNVDPLILLSLTLLACIYVRGLTRFWRKKVYGSRINGWRAMSYGGALVLLLVALISPLDALSAELTSFHMTQHMLLTNIAAPLFVIGSPGFVLAWGLPEFRRGRGSSIYTFALRLPQEAILWHPLFLAALFAVTMWAWHHPALYQTALQDPLVHDAQHLSFFVAACLFWRACLDPFGSRRLNPVAATVYLFATSLHSSALGIYLALSPRTWYPDYAGRTAAWGFTPLQDQQVAGLIMWMLACLCFPAVAAILFATWLRNSERSPTARTKTATITLRENPAL